MNTLGYISGSHGFKTATAVVESSCGGKLQNPLFQRKIFHPVQSGCGGYSSYLLFTCSKFTLNVSEHSTDGTGLRMLAVIVTRLENFSSSSITMKGTTFTW